MKNRLSLNGKAYFRLSKNLSVLCPKGACSGLHLLEKMLAFLRSVSNFFDTLK